MPRKTRIFISYKSGEADGLSSQARAIWRWLKTAGYDVWFDSSELKAGVEWNKEIYNEIPGRDVLLLLLAPSTVDSDWVRREIDVAKGAKVTIVPVAIRDGFDKKAALDKFDIGSVQYGSLLEGTDKEYEELCSAIEEIKERTREEQRGWLIGLQDQEEERKPIKPAQRSFFTYRVNDAQEAPEIHLAAGSIIEMKGIDVFVNSENDFMQMARIFESITISSMLRFHGSLFDDANRLMHDSVQDELNKHMRGALGPRPVGKYAVVVTSAGHPESDLRTKNGARYIFHAATVSVVGDGIGKRIEAIENESGIRSVVKKVLEQVAKVDAKKGVVSPDGSDERAKQEEDQGNYQEIKSLILPIFGTGHGGRPIQMVAPAIAQGIREFVVEDKKSKLERIHVCAYFEDDVRVLDDALSQHFEKVVTSPS